MGSIHGRKRNRKGSVLNSVNGGANTSTNGPLASLAGQINRDEVSMDLTEAGLLVERTEAIADIYAETLDWSKTKELWHDQRLADRGSRHSAQKIFRVIRSRFQAAGDSLPTIPQLANLYNTCVKARDKAQLTYLYLVHADPLVRFTLHELLRDQGLEVSEWMMDNDLLIKYLEAFRFDDGDSLEYANSTLKRWTQGFRSVLHDVGVRDSPYSNKGHPPGLDRIPLLVTAGYSWKEQEEQWQEHPIGWMYLFQPRHHWDQLFDRLGEDANWTTRHVRNQLLLRPADNPFDVEGDNP